MDFLRIDPRDNVLIAPRDLPAGRVVVHEKHQIVLPEAIPAKHKFLVEGEVAGAVVRMYGAVYDARRDKFKHDGTRRLKFK